MSAATLATRTTYDVELHASVFDNGVFVREDVRNYSVEVPSIDLAEFSALRRHTDLLENFHPGTVEAVSFRSQDGEREAFVFVGDRTYIVRVVAVNLLRK